MSLKKSAKISEKNGLGGWQSPKDCDSCSTCWQRLSLCWFPSPGDNCRCTDGEKSRQARVFADELRLDEASCSQSVILSAARMFCETSFTGAESKDPENVCCVNRPSGVLPKKRGENSLRPHVDGKTVGILRLALIPARRDSGLLRMTDFSGDSCDQQRSRR